MIRFHPRLLPVLKVFLIRGADRVLFGLPPVLPQKANGHAEQKTH